jgi:predicted NBD/HSP70 family sugar kinase
MSQTPLLIGMHVSGAKLQAALVDTSGNVSERVETEISPQNMMSRRQVLPERWLLRVEMSQRWALQFLV